MKNLHDIIQKNSETIDEKLNKYVELFTMTGRYDDVGLLFIKTVKKVSHGHLLSSQLSIIQAIDEWAEGKKMESKTGLRSFDFDKARERNKLIRELRSFLSEAKGHNNKL